MEADYISTYSVLLFWYQLFECMLIDLKPIFTKWVLTLLFYPFWSLMLLGGLCITGLGGWLPCFENSEKFFVEVGRFFSSFSFSSTCKLNIFLGFTPNLFCLWCVFSGRERFHRYSKFKILATYFVFLREPFKWHFRYDWGSCRGLLEEILFPCLIFCISYINIKTFWKFLF